MLAGALVPRIGGRAVDLEVYRTAGTVAAHHLPLYREGYPWGLGVWLPFTYPPFAVLVLGPLALAPPVVATALLTLVGLLALSLTGRWSRVAAGLGPLHGAGLVAAAAVALAVEPVRSTLFFGQVNLLLAALVLVDLLPERTRWPHGLLVGVAAAVKLTPLVFVVLLLVRRERRAALTAVATFLAAQGLAALVLPRDSADYWLGGVLTSPSRVGGVETASNQSLRGVLARAWPEAPGWLWVLLAALVLGLTVVAALRCTRRGDRLGAVLCTAAGGLLVSPVSWTHHWVWVVPALVRLVPWVRGGGRGRLVVALLPLAAFLVGPSGLLPSGDGREETWSWWQQVLGSAYVEAALVVLVVAALPARRRTARRRVTRATTAVATSQPPVTSPGTPSPR